MQPIDVHYYAPLEIRIDFKGETKAKVIMEKEKFDQLNRPDLLYKRYPTHVFLREPNQSVIREKALILTGTTWKSEQPDVISLSFALESFD